MRSMPRIRVRTSTLTIAIVNSVWAAMTLCGPEAELRRAIRRAK